MFRARDAAYVAKRANHGSSPRGDSFSTTRRSAALAKPSGALVLVVIDVVSATSTEAKRSTSATPHHLFSYAQYLAREQETGLKHEFQSGQIFAMAGGTPEHARLITEVALALRSLVDPSKCRIFVSELKVRVKRRG